MGWLVANTVWYFEDGKYHNKLYHWRPFYATKNTVYVCSKCTSLNVGTKYSVPEPKMIICSFIYWTLWHYNHDYVHFKAPTLKVFIFICRGKFFSATGYDIKAGVCLFSKALNVVKDADKFMQVKNRSV